MIADKKRQFQQFKEERRATSLANTKAELANVAKEKELYSAKVKLAKEKAAVSKMKGQTGFRAVLAQTRKNIQQNNTGGGSNLWKDSTPLNNVWGNTQVKGIAHNQAFNESGRVTAHLFGKNKEPSIRAKSSNKKVKGRKIVIYG